MSHCLLALVLFAWKMLKRKETATKINNCTVRGDENVTESSKKNITVSSKIENVL